MRKPGGVTPQEELGGLITRSAEEELEHCVRRAMAILGLDLNDPDYAKTPKRVAKFWIEYNQPVKLEDVLSAQFDLNNGEETLDSGTRSMVIQRDIPFSGLCPHHLLPFFGKAAIAYVPRGKVVGLSKLTRLVRAAGRLRPMTQERITDLIADTLYKTLDCIGVAVVIEAVHTCMAVRGVLAPEVTTTTSAVRGVFRDVPAAREEFLKLIRK